MDEFTLGIPSYAIWLPSTGVLGTLAGLLINQDKSVKGSLKDRRDMSLGRLNEFIWERVRAAKSIVIPEDYSYDAVRHDADLEELTGFAKQAMNTRRLGSINGWFTRVLITVVVAQGAGGILLLWLALRDSVASDAAAESNLIPWSILTGIALVSLLAKLVTFLLSHD